MSVNEKIAELLNDESFMNGLDNIHSMEEFREAFSAHGVELTVEEVKELAKSLVIVSKDGELNAEQLENVSGGLNIFKVVSDLWNAAKKGWSYGQKFCDWMYNTFGIV